MDDAAKEEEGSPPLKKVRLEESFVESDQERPPSDSSSVISMRTEVISMFPRLIVDEHPIFPTNQQPETSTNNDEKFVVPALPKKSTKKKSGKQPKKYSRETMIQVFQDFVDAFMNEYFEDSDEEMRREFVMLFEGSGRALERELEPIECRHIVFEEQEEVYQAVMVFKDPKNPQQTVVESIGLNYAVQLFPELVRKFYDDHLKKYRKRKRQDHDPENVSQKPFSISSLLV